MTKKTPKILMIVTSNAHMGSTGQKTGFWLEELAAPYREFTRAGATVDIASPLGGEPPTDPKSLPGNAVSQEFLADSHARAKLKSTLRLDQVSSDYDAYFVVGGHGVMWDLVDSADVQRVLGDAHDAGKVVAAVCHGPAALTKVRRGNGELLVKGHRVAGFSDEEEAAVGLDKVVPFALETKLREIGGRYERGPTWGSFAVRDGRLVTGQNPASSVAVVREVLAALEPTAIAASAPSAS